MAEACEFCVGKQGKVTQLLVPNQPGHVQGPQVSNAGKLFDAQD